MRRAARALAVMDRLGLAGKGHLFPGQLSGGEQQRVAVARALVKDPAFCFADEPTSALDWARGREVIELLRKSARRRGAVVLVVAHDSRILPYADRVYYLVQRPPFNNTCRRWARIIESCMKAMRHSLRPNSYVVAAALALCGTGIGGMLRNPPPNHTISRPSSGRCDAVDGPDVICLGYVDVEGGVAARADRARAYRRDIGHRGRVRLQRGCTFASGGRCGPLQPGTSERCAKAGRNTAC